MPALSLLLAMNPVGLRVSWVLVDLGSGARDLNGFVIGAKLLVAAGLAYWLLRFTQKPVFDSMNDARQRSGLPSQDLRTVRIVVFVGLGLVAFMVLSAF
jgi:hypothetical protein